MTAKPPNEPWRHHYVPKFLLQQWCNEEGKLAVYQKLPTGEVTVDWKVPKSVGFEPKLYTFPALGEAATSIETRLFGRLDTEAAKIVQRMIETGGEELEPDEKQWWSYFLLGMIIRGPESTRALKDAATEMWAAPDPKTQAEYEKRKGPDDPLTMEEWLISEAGSNERGGQQLGHRLLHSLVMHGGLAERILQMEWFVMVSHDDSEPFLTSDRPIFTSNGIGKENGQILLPIGPRHLFMAFWDRGFARDVTRSPVHHTIDLARKFVTVRAQKYVYASTADESEFVRSWFGYERVTSIGETLAANWAANGLGGDDGDDETTPD
ncbi:DUF4238 domain-containing protein [Brevundimonas naejangsanensis]|uniref:DUF4238 domain-containing protein n=1 Tax=Brevundimonas naejangsanensis TaxID=588932 RepID=A0A494RGK7_9CAUL|nr:DUF4238 domain-containing protein [Brevundimonas naejangsanensis]AYG95617.1 DUF4238 domain-containing protein [Brevundimonas naejangsanensis]